MSSIFVPMQIEPNVSRCAVICHGNLGCRHFPLKNWFLTAVIKTKGVPIYVPANWFDLVPHVTPIYAKRWIPTVSQNGTGTALCHKVSYAVPG